MNAATFRRICATTVFLLLFGLLSNAAEASSNDRNSGEDGSTNAIIQRFVQATQNHEDALRGSSMQVSIDASIPKLNEHGTLRALRLISKVGTVAYRKATFQGDNTVKTEVIARYLQAEQQGQGDQSVAITPENYKFKNRGEKHTAAGDVYVFQLTPRKKRVGLFKGELWLDPKTYLPVLEKGKLVKNPSVWFKKVEFERKFAVQNGLAVPQRVEISTDVRLFGRVQMNIDFSDYQPNAVQADAEPTGEPHSLLWTGRPPDRTPPSLPVTCRNERVGTAFVAARCGFVEAPVQNIYAKN